MKLEDVKQFFEDNKDNEEVKAYVATLAPAITADQVSEFLKENQSVYDSLTGKAISSFKEKGMQKILEEERTKLEKELRAKLDPPKNPLEEKVAEIARELAETKEAERRARLENIVVQKMPENLRLYSSRLIGTDEESTSHLVDEFLKNYNLAINSEVEKRVQPALLKKGVGAPMTTTNPFSKESWNMTEQGRLYKEDPVKARELQAKANL